jgi:glycosyltransferase involved in cell wall biosynthesis
MKNECSPISVVIATLNEEEGIGPTLGELQQVLKYPYLLVVDGNSVDRTIEIAKNMGADVVLQEGKGKGAALFQGVRKVNHGSRYIVFTDADYTYPAEFIPKMIEVMDHDPNIGMVIGNRFDGENNQSKSITNPFYLGNKILAIAHNVLNGVRLGDPLSGLRVVRAEILERWKPKSTGFEVETELNFFVEREGYKISEIPIDYRSRLGEKKLKVHHGLAIMKRILTESLIT